MVADHMPLHKRVALLDAIGQVGKDEGEREDPLPDPYDIEKLFKNFAEEETTTPLTKQAISKLAQLQIKYYHVFSYGRRMTFNYELRIVADEPAQYVEFLKSLYAPDDGAEETPNNDELLNQHFLEFLFQFFLYLNLGVEALPWVGDDHLIDRGKLQKWIEEVRQGAKDAGRLQKADATLGRGLGSTDFSSDFMPQTAICEIVETVNSDIVSNNFYSGARNARGATTGGIDNKGFSDQDLANGYHKASNIAKTKGYNNTARILLELSQAYHRDAERHIQDYERDDLNWR